ncbi:cyclin-dependent kinase 2-interacting protein-like [Saccoglossus kowalevskii]|uniref:Cyclin-dependent kinase 2-interacting protein-like n=1 Tax=Saccoglossus kowalevskii TaxID=10224 RepID=A0ABM0M6H4_SACKO|nr:PREDICTED: cyclin-dependent kinase 2-interacting protein-like [Saccoglossus kowalevskii]
MEKEKKGKTPKKKRDSCSSESSSISGSSPYQSATRQSPKPTSLTGSSRKIKDHCADWHNYINKWQILNEQGFGITSKISNCKLQAQSGEAAETAVISADTDNDGTSTNKMPPEMQEHCEQLHSIYSSMAKLVKKMETICKNFRGICDLEGHKKDGDWSEEPLFQMWSTEQFYEASCTMLSMYSTELEVKHTILEEIAHCDERDLLLFYNSTWLHQPYIEEKSKLLLESMLLETGHR